MTANLLDFYKKQLTEQILPFWHHAMDLQNGGVYTCFNNAGTKLFSKDKFTWSQGRYIWLLARLHEMCKSGTLTGDGNLYLQQAERTVRFLKKHAFMENGHCAFLLSESGEKKEVKPGSGYDSSIYADCFVVLGFTEYARVTGDASTLARALSLFDSILQRLRDGRINSDPYPIPPKCEAHAISMILLNVTQELADVLQKAKHHRSPEMYRLSRQYMQAVMERFCRADYSIAEIISDEPAMQHSLLVRHFNPGHTIECMWFVLKSAIQAGRQDIVRQAIAVIKRAFQLGWDAKYGGLFRYVDREGGEPKGTYTGAGFEDLIRETWSMKIWWPHSEALYSTLYAYELSKDSELIHLYEKTHRYAFHTFPNPDTKVGEWIQIRDRAGKPFERVVALPVKDPYHIIRNFILIVELLEGKRQHTERYVSI